MATKALDRKRANFILAVLVVVVVVAVVDVDEIDDLQFATCNRRAFIAIRLGVVSTRSLAVCLCFVDRKWKYANRNLVFILCVT